MAVTEAARQMILAVRKAARHIMWAATLLKIEAGAPARLVD